MVVFHCINQPCFLSGQNTVCRFSDTDIEITETRNQHFGIDCNDRLNIFRAEEWLLKQRNIVNKVSAPTGPMTQDQSQQSSSVTDYAQN